MQTPDERVALVVITYLVHAAQRTSGFHHMPRLAEALHRAADLLHFNADLNPARALVMRKLRVGWRYGYDMALRGLEANDLSVEQLIGHRAATTAYGGTYGKGCNVTSVFTPEDIDRDWLAWCEL